MALLHFFDLMEQSLSSPASLNANRLHKIVHVPYVCTTHHTYIISFSVCFMGFCTGKSASVHIEPVKQQGPKAGR